MTGLPGSGKTTLVKSPHFPQSAVAVTFADVMSDVLRHQFHGKTLENLWPHERAVVQLEAAKRMVHKESDRLLVIDGHLIVPTKRGWEPGVSAPIWESIRLISIVVVRVPPMELISRMPDKLSNNSGYSIEQLKGAQNFVDATAAHFAAANSGVLPGRVAETGEWWHGCALKEIVNAESRQVDAERELGEYIDALGR
ncbi:AAA family ATPase (plasmid) [Paenarthrobacter ureafaciens]